MLTRPLVLPGPLVQESEAPANAPLPEHPWKGCTCLGCGAPIDEDGYCSAHRGDIEAALCMKPIGGDELDPCTRPADHEGACE